MKLKLIEISETSKTLSANGGAALLESIWHNSEITQITEKILPKKRRKAGICQQTKLKSLIFSTAMGSDALDDLDKVRNDEVYREFAGGGVSARSAGDFLRSFSHRQYQQLQDALIEQALVLRKGINDEEESFDLTIDATPHVQYGKKMEGIGWNYKKLWCLESQNACDQYGICYGFDLREGGTHSNVGSSEMLYRIFKKVPLGLSRRCRGDSAYANKENYQMLIGLNVKFVFVLPENRSKVARRANKNHLHWTPFELGFFGEKDCEMGSGIYNLRGKDDEKATILRLIFIRVKKQEEQLNFLDQDKDGYVYYTLITNMLEQDIKAEKVVDFYRGRANIENFIKEEKGAAGLKNFPCQKLSANKVYGVIGMMAYNMMRTLSFFIEKKGCYLKRVRQTLIRLPCQVVKHARKIILRFNQPAKEVMSKTMKNISNKFSRVSLERT